MPSASNAIDALCARRLAGVGKRRAALARVYAEGAKSKLSQASLCITALNRQQPTATAPVSLEVAALYVDAYFASLRAAFDIFGQLVNQIENLNLNEKKADLPTAIEHLRKSLPNHPALPHYDRIAKSKYFKNLRDYRNCSLHRRAICIRAETQTVTQTPGYVTTGPLHSEVKYLCDAPLATKPTFKQRRSVPQYCSDLLKHADKQLAQLAASF
jgi:hypothetical protein